MSKILVTGGSGFFGEIMCKKLLNQEHTVIVLDINLPGFSHKNLKFIQADIRNTVQVAAAVADVDIIHHNVAQVPLAKDNKLFWSVNYNGIKNILEAACKAKITKLVYTSSSAVFGVPPANPVTNETEPNPQEEYGKAKYAGEKLCLEYAKKELDVSIVRPRTILGPGRLGIFQILFEWIYQGKNIPVLGKGDNIYQFVHMNDMADACIAAGFLPGHDIFNIGASEFGSMREALVDLTSYADTGSHVKSAPMRLAVWAMKSTSAIGLSPLGAYHALMYGHSMYFDISHAQQKLAYNPQYSNNAMFRENYDWYVQNRQAILSGSVSGSKHQSALKQKALKLLPFFLK